MAIKEFRAQHPEYNDMPDDTIADRLYERHKADYSDMTKDQFKAKFLAGASQPPAPGRTPSGSEAASAPALPTTPAGVFMAVPKAAYGMAKSAVTDLANIPRGLVADPLSQVFQNRAATPDEEKRSFSGLAGLTGLVTAPGISEAATMGAAKLGGPKLLQKILAGAGAGALLGGGDAAIRSGGQASAIPQGVAGGAALGGAFGGVLPAHKVGQGYKPVTGDAGMLARSGAGALSSVEERLNQMGPEGNEITSRVKTADNLGEVLAGEAKVKLRRAGFHKLTAEEDAQVHDAMQGMIKPEHLDMAMTPRARAVFGILDDYRQTVIPRARGAGLKTGILEDYFPQHEATPEHMGSGKVREDMISNFVRRGWAPSREAAAAVIDDYLAAKAGDEGAGELAAQVIGHQNGLELPEASARMRRGFTQSRTTKMGNLERSRDYNSPFYDPSPSRQMPRYIENAEHRIAEANQLGPEGQRIEALLNNIQNPEDRTLANRLSRVATGSLEPQDEGVAKWMRRGKGFSATKLGPLSAIRNLSQTPTNSLLRSDPGSFAKGLLRSATRAGEETAIGSGATSEHSLHNVAHQVGTESGFVSKWLKAVGFSQSEAVNRRIAANIGYEYTKKMAVRAAKGDQFAVNELKSLGVDPANAAAMSERDLLTGAKVFNDQTQFRSRPLDLPAFMSDNPVTGNMSQFKGFSFQHGRLLAKETLDRLRSGKPGDKARAARNLAILATVFPLTGEAVNNINSFLQGRHRDSKGVERVLEDFSQVGGVGLGADILQSTKYGEGDQGGSVAKTLVGPTLASVAGGVQTAADAQKKGELTDTGKRFLLRQGLGGVGSLLAPRLVPYKNEKRKKKSN